MNIGLEGFHAFLRWTSWQLIAWWVGNKLSSSSSGCCSQEAEKWSGTPTEGSRQARCGDETAESEALCLTANLLSSLHLSSGSGIQATEMSLLWRGSGLSPRDITRHSETQKEIKAEPLLHIERNQLRCFEKLVRMPSWQVFCALGSPGTQWRHNIRGLAWNHLWIPLMGLVEMARVTQETCIRIRVKKGKDVCFSFSFCSFLTVLSPLQSIAGSPIMGLVLTTRIHLLVIVAGRAASPLEVPTRTLLSFSLLRDRNV